MIIYKVGKTKRGIYGQEEVSLLAQYFRIGVKRCFRIYVVLAFYASYDFRNWQRGRIIQRLSNDVRLRRKNVRRSGYNRFGIFGNELY